MNHHEGSSHPASPPRERCCPRARSATCRDLRVRRAWGQCVEHRCGHRRHKVLDAEHPDHPESDRQRDAAPTCGAPPRHGALARSSAAPRWPDDARSPPGPVERSAPARVVPGPPHRRPAPAGWPSLAFVTGLGLGNRQHVQLDVRHRPREAAPANPAGVRHGSAPGRARRLPSWNPCLIPPPAGHSPATTYSRPPDW